MDLSKSAHRKPENARAEDPAIMLFGKQITNLSSKDADNIKEELSPRGVDEKGLSFATSSDEEEDLNPTCEDDVLVKQSASPVIASVLASALARGHARKRKAVENECIAPRDKDAAQPKSNASGPITLRMGGDNRAGKLKGGMSIRCPRCNSADTKFCYFNNYNVSQPRHFCKHCQRYWTAGGTLRNVPIGAGKRKNKHALHKHNFAANSTSELTVPKTNLPVGVADADPLSIAKSEPLPTSESKPLSIEETNPVNTNLELSAHHSFTDSPMPSLSPCNIAHPQSAHKLITLHQAHENLQSRLGQINHPHLATGCSKLGQIYPNLACGSSPLSPIHPELAGGCSKLGQFYADSASGSPGLSQISPFLPNGSYGLSQICPHLCGGFPGLHQICPGLRSEFARLGPHLQTGSSRLCYTDPHVQGGACKTSQECLDYKRDELSGLAKSERGFSEIDELKGNFESELPMSDQKKASLERGLPDSARTALEKGNLENKARASCLQIGHPELDPMEVDNYMQRLNEMKSMRCSASSNECKGHMRGACNGLMETKAPPLHAAQATSTSALRIESQEGPFHIETIMKRGTVGEEHMSFPIWASLWPYFYNMLWLDPLAFPHLRPILTPQGWALPFIPPSASKIEPPPNNSPHNVRTPTTCVLENFDSSSTTLTTTTSTLSAPFTSACNIATTSPARKCYPTPTTTTSLGNFEHVSDGGTCNVAPKALH